MAKAFPVLWTGFKGEHVPLTVPWEWIEKFERRAMRNHSQTIQRLAERGGLGPSEIWCAVHDKGLWDAGIPSEPEAAHWLRGAPWMSTSAEADSRVDRD